MARKSKEVKEETSSLMDEVFSEPEVPAKPVEQVTPNRDKIFCPVCGGTGFVFVGEGQLERCWPCSGTGVTDA